MSKKLVECPKCACWFGLDERDREVLATKEWDCAQCKRHAPVASMERIPHKDGDFSILWPTTWGHDGCFDGIPRKKGGKK